MRKLIYFIILFLYTNNLLLAQTDGIRMELEYTCDTFGCGLLLTVDNTTDKLYYQIINPFLLNTGKNSQAFLIPFGQIINVKAGEKKVFDLNAYPVFPDRPPHLDSKYKLTANIIEEAINKKQESFEIFFEDSTRYKIRKVKISELIPFDYILTVPGTFEMLQFTFDVEENHDLATTLLVEQAQRLVKAYDRLFTAGRIVSHFNADQIFERELFLQLSIWICGSGIEGKALKNPHIKKIISELYTKFSLEDKSKEIDEHIDTYYKILERIGKESNVFLVPMDFDKKPQCLPAIVGLVPTSDNIKTQTISKTRQDKILVRNQVMHTRNDCLPCILSEEMHSSLKNYIYGFEVNRMIAEFNNLYIELNNRYDSSSDARTSLNNAVAKLENLKNYDAVSWLKDKEVSLEERIAIAINEYNQISKDLIKTGMGAGLLQTAAVFTIVSAKHKYLLQYTLDNYYISKSSYSFDCCDITHKPDLSEIQLAEELVVVTELGINRASKAFHNISDKLKNRNSSHDDLINEFIKAGSELYSLQALQKSFSILTSKNQVICLEGPAPTSRIEALRRVNDLLGTNIQKTGEFLRDKLFLRINENEQLEFHFGDCNCGKEKESHMPLLPLQENSLNALNNLEKLPINLTPRFELSAYYGRLFLSKPGADKFNGGGLSSFDSINPQLDSTFESRYNKFYSLKDPKDFIYNYFNHISIIAAVDLHENFQYRIGASFFTGSVEGNLPLHYYEKLSDSSTLVIVNGLIYSKIKAWSIESGFRYYYGKQFKIYGGLNAQYMSFTNTESRTYMEDIEIQVQLVEKHHAFSAFIETGIRYYPNQDFFIELGGQLFNRWDTDIDNTKVSATDKSFRLGIGARF